MLIIANAAAYHGFSQYFCNATARMVEAIFKDYVRRLDRAMEYQKRRVLLILDNFTGHKIQELYTPNNIEFLLLPPNPTTLLQPLDAGIIKNFKTHYRWDLAAFQMIAVKEQNKQLTPINLR